MVSLYNNNERNYKQKAKKKSKKLTLPRFAQLRTFPLSLCGKCDVKLLDYIALDLIIGLI